MNEALPRVVNVRRSGTPGSYVSTCNCGPWVSDEFPAPGDAVEAVVEHCREHHPEFMDRLMAAVFPPAEYCASPVPVADFVAMMSRMMGAPAPRKLTARRRRP